MGIFFRGKVSCTASTTKACQQLRLYLKYVYSSLVTLIRVVDGDYARMVLAFVCQWQQ